MNPTETTTILTMEGDLLKMEGVDEMLFLNNPGDLDDLIVPPLETLLVSPFFPPFMLLFKVPLLLLLFLLFFTFKVSMILFPSRVNPIVFSEYNPILLPLRV